MIGSGDGGGKGGGGRGGASVVGVNTGETGGARVIGSGAEELEELEKGVGGTGVVGND